MKRLHLRAIHAADHSRADVRVSRLRTDNTTDQLRDEMPERTPLRWPLRVNPNNNPRGE